MRFHGAARHIIAGAILVLVLTLALVLTSRSSAAAEAASTPATQAAAGARRASGAPGSAENPIRIGGLSAVAPPRVQPGAGGRVELRLGPVRATLFGISGAVPSPGAAMDTGGRALRDPESDRFWGAGMELRVAPSGGLLLDGGRVTLEDPLDALGDSTGEYWTTSAGLEIRF